MITHLVASWVLLSLGQWRLDKDRKVKKNSENTSSCALRVESASCFSQEKSRNYLAFIAGNSREVILPREMI